MNAAPATPHFVRCDDIPPQPWRNGGGRTRELLTWPHAGNWLCRISVADIERDGPFSVLAGVDRWFAVAEGAGVQLQLPEGAVTLDSFSTTVFFPGEAAPGCRLLGGPTRDLNLMSVRGQGDASMQRALPDTPWHAPATLRAMFTADPVTLRRGGVEPRPVSPFTLVWAAESTGDSWSIHTTMEQPRAWWMSFLSGGDPCIR